MIITICLLFSSLLLTTSPKGCVNHNGQSVDWWLSLKVPPLTGKSGFGYIDSKSTSASFEYISSHIDEGRTALTLTLIQINDYNMQTVAWNDQKPTGQTSTTSAHSKGLISFSQSDQNGFLLSHSIPKYPAFENHKVKLTISAAQNYYGQHLLCLSLNLVKLNALSYRLMITRVNVYQSNIANAPSSAYIYQLASSTTQRISADFQYEDLKPYKSIYKNGFTNSSIFQDGLTNYLKSNLIAETWGRPIQSAWCSTPYRVNNVQQVTVGGITWQEADDHSKWVISDGHACFGDMNRMSSQWKRGGAFYCLDNGNLVGAMKKIVVSSDKC